MLISSGFTKLGIFCLNLPYHIILSLFTLQYVIGNLVESIEKILPRKIYSLPVNYFRQFRVFYTKLQEFDSHAPN